MTYLINMRGLLPPKDGDKDVMVIPDWVADLIIKQAHEGDRNMIAVRDRMVRTVPDGVITDPNLLAHRCHAKAKEARSARLLALVAAP